MKWNGIIMVVGVVLADCMVAMNGSDGEPSGETQSPLVPTRNPELRLPARKGAQAGYIDGTGQFAIEPRFVMASVFSEGLAPVCREVTREAGGTLVMDWQFIGPSGAVVIPGPFERVRSFSGGMAPFLRNGKWGFINNKGKEVIAPSFDAVGAFSEGRAPVAKHGEWGIIDETGTLILQPKYEWISTYKEGLARFKKNDLLGYLDCAGRVVIPASHGVAEDFSEGLAFAETRLPRGGYLGGYIDKTGKYLIPPRFSTGGPFRGGLAAINGAAFEAHYINRAGDKALAPAKVQWAGNFAEGLAAIKKNGKFGYIDTGGHIIIPPQWDSAEEFSLGVARVEAAGITGYINTRGEYIWKGEP